MLASILREFNLSTESHQEQRESRRQGGQPYKVWVIEVSLTHRATEKTCTGTCSGHFSDLEVFVERLVMQHFPETKVAEALRSRTGLDVFQLVPGWQDNVGERFHTALRKLCDSKPTSFWWNLLHELPAPLFRMLCEHTRRALTEVGARAEEHQYATAMKTAWSSVFDDALALRDPLDPATRQRLSDRGWPVDEMDEKSRKDLDAIHRFARLAWLSVDYLSPEDWQGVLGYLIEPVVDASPVVPVTAEKE